MSHEPAPVQPRRGGFGSCCLGAFLTLLAVAVLLLGGLFAMQRFWPDLNPFAPEEVDRTGPSVLQSLTDLSEYHAASAHYETVVDLEKETRFVPDFLSGERLLYVAKGNVDAVVDFSHLDGDSVTTSEDGTSVSISLPAPRVDKPELDLEGSYVAVHDKGLVDTFTGSELERQAQLTAVEKMTEAAAEADNLIDLAEVNTTAMLRGLLGALGYTDISITFAQ